MVESAKKHECNPERLNTPEAVRENFAKAFELFSRLCKNVQFGNFDQVMSEVSKRGASSVQIEGGYEDPALPGESVARARLGILSFLERDLGTSKVVPVIGDGSRHYDKNYWYLIYQFIQSGIEFRTAAEAKSVSK